MMNVADISADGPLVSIVITSYNYEKFIGTTIQSVLSQTYPRWELIVIDDCSTDNSVEVIQSFQDERITLLRNETNMGAGLSYNRAYERTTGEYFCSVDSDDYMAADRLEKQVGYLQRHADVSVLGTFVHEVDAEGRLTGDKYKHEEWFNQPLDLNEPQSWMWRNHLNHSSVLMKRGLHEEAGPMNRELIYTGDYEFWARCFAHGKLFHVLPEKLTYYRYHGSNMTHRDPRQELLEYVYIHHTVLWPYWFETNRPELVALSISKAPFDRFYVELEPATRERLLARLISGEREGSFSEFVRALDQESSPAHPFAASLIDRFYSAQTEQLKYAESLKSNIRWLEGHKDRWEAKARLDERTLKEKNAWIKELERGKAWSEEQRQHWETEAKNLNALLQEQRAWNEEVERGKSWLEAQRDKWEAEATRAAELLQAEYKRSEALELRAAELERTATLLEGQQAALEWEKSQLKEQQAYLSTQHEHWQAEAERLLALWQEQRAWNEELERGKSWLDERRASLEAEAARNARLLREEVERSEALEQQRAQLEDGTARLEEEKARLEGQAVQLQANIARLEEWQTSLELEKSQLKEQQAYLSTQHEHWQAEAERLLLLWQEQRAWNEELERGKSWLEEQREHWQAQARLEAEHASQLFEELAALQRQHAELLELIREREAKSLTGRLRRVRSYLRSAGHSTNPGS